MAVAPGHRLGQIIGDVLELAIEPPLAAFCAEHDLYLDGKRARAARSGVKVTWHDDLGNKHDLDHVIERGGTEEEVGIPAAFIEVAWRRYTKHSKNKAQEVQAAILPVLAKWNHVKPFAGVVLAGEFTEAALEQLRSNGFVLLRIPYAAVISAFAVVGVDLVYDETTPDAHLRTQIDRYEALPDEAKAAIGEALREESEHGISDFIASLAKVILRRVDRVSILPLYGVKTSVETAEAAVQLLGSDQPGSAAGPPIRFEVVVRYDNGDHITTEFDSAAEAITFLESFD